MNRATLYLVCLLVIMVSCPSFMEHSKAQEGTQTTSLYAEAFAYNEATGRYAVGYTDEDTTFVVRIYDALTEQILHTVDIPDPRLNRFFRQLYFGDFKFSPSGDRLALSLEGPDGGGFFIVDVATGQLVLQQPWASIWHITWSPDGEFLAGIYHYSITEVSDGWLGLWDTHTGQEINQHRISPSSFTLDWHPSDNRLVIADRHYVVVWDAENWQEVYRVPAAEDYETAADTFLNWVYRRTSDSTAISLNLDDACIISGTGKWLGFQNINKQNEPEIYQDSQGSNHNARSGNRRYVWMHIIIEGVFNGKP